MERSACDKRELIRERLRFDRPSPFAGEVAAFERKDAHDSYEALRCLRPCRKRRVGRVNDGRGRLPEHRYERDGEKMLAWRYRDYVIRH